MVSKPPYCCAGTPRRRASIKVLARPANVFHTDHAHHLAADLNDCLAKPFEEAELYAKLQKLLRRP